MKKVNHYVAWNPYHDGCRSAYAQGVAETEEEFRAMCEEQGIDLTDTDVELERENAHDELGRPARKYVKLD